MSKNWVITLSDGSTVNMESDTQPTPEEAMNWINTHGVTPSQNIPQSSPTPSGQLPQLPDQPSDN